VKERQAANGESSEKDEDMDPLKVRSKGQRSGIQKSHGRNTDLHGYSRSLKSETEGDCEAAGGS
jgi:hypothetical protein